MATQRIHFQHWNVDGGMDAFWEYNDVNNRVEAIVFEAENFDRLIEMEIETDEGEPVIGEQRLAKRQLHSVAIPGNHTMVEGTDGIDTWLRAPFRWQIRLLAPEID